MFIFDEPFISNLAIETINNNAFEALLNPLVKNKIDKLFLKSELKSKFLANQKLYTNSENSIQAILDELNGTKLVSWINLFKDKVKFRDFLNSIYPDFYYKKVSYEELNSLNKDELKYPFVIKPSVGFLSFGVYTVYKKEEFDDVILKIKSSMENSKGLFPEVVLNSNNFIIEEFIEGNEFAIDVYFDDKSCPVILNIFQHPFYDAFDVSDRMYLTSTQIIKDNLSIFNNLLEQIGKGLKLVNFPMHIEVRKKGDKVVPIEVNPLRFAGWCTCDLAYYAYGINVYEYFIQNKKPNWDLICKNDKNSYAFIMGEVPPNLNKNDIMSFDIEAFKKDVNAKVLDTREFDFKTKPMFCVLFVKSENEDKLKHVLGININKYIELK